MSEYEVTCVHIEKFKSIILTKFFQKHSINTDTHTRMSTQPYEHTRTPYLYEHL
jgi:hypothetical protein